MNAQLTLLVISGLALTLEADAQPLRVQVLNGRDAQPVVREHVNIFRAGSSGDLSGDRNITGLTTDADGVITISDIALDTKFFYVFVDWHRQCTKAKNVVPFSLPNVLAKGVVSENTCKPAITRASAPGTLILFVRDESLFEKMAH